MTTKVSMNLQFSQFVIFIDILKCLLVGKWLKNVFNTIEVKFTVFFLTVILFKSNDQSINQSTTEILNINVQ